MSLCKKASIVISCQIHMDIKEYVKLYPDSLIARSYAFAEKAHSGQKRASGEAYFEHPKKVAAFLLEWNMDEETIAAGLLHDVVEDTECSMEDIKKEFGDHVAFLVDGITKLGRVKYRGEEAQRENIKKLILASSEDIRVLIIKLADRYHNMQTLKYLKPAKQYRIALETYEIYAPIAYRLGMQHLSGELEDLAFPYINPDGYKWLISNVKVKYEDREKYLHRIKPIVVAALRDAGIEPVKIDFRAKRYSSLYKKLVRYDMNIERIYDLIAFRIIVNSLADCYAALGVIHSLWPPVPGRFKDYIAMPKPNGYKSLHTVVFGKGNQHPIEFQIRTQEMHESAENGIAAHWAYEEKKGTQDYSERIASIAKEKEIQWVKQLRNWQNESSDDPDFIDSMKIDFFKDRIFAVTPKGEVIDLPAGATPVDFAYRIHSTVGDQTIGAKINGDVVPLDAELHSGDVCAVVTQKGKKPSSAWLEFVKTAHAKQCIRRALNEKGSNLVIAKKKHTELKILAIDKIGLLKEITDIVSRSHVNILDIESNPKNNGGSLIIKVSCEMHEIDKIFKIIAKIKDLKEVREIDYKIISE